MRSGEHGGRCCWCGLVMRSSGEGSWCLCDAVGGEIEAGGGGCREIGQLRPTSAMVVARERGRLGEGRGGSGDRARYFGPA